MAGEQHAAAAAPTSAAEAVQSAATAASARASDEPADSCKNQILMKIAHDHCNSSAAHVLNIFNSTKLE